MFLKCYLQNNSFNSFSFYFQDSVELIILVLLHKFLFLVFNTKNGIWFWAGFYGFCVQAVSYVNRLISSLFQHNKLYQLLTSVWRYQRQQCHLVSTGWPGQHLPSLRRVPTALSIQNLLPVFRVTTSTRKYTPAVLWLASTAYCLLCSDRAVSPARTCFMLHILLYQLLMHSTSPSAWLQLQGDHWVEVVSTVNQVIKLWLKGEQA